MWELICDHRYGWGAIAADRSKWRSDGHVHDVSALSGGAGLRFNSQQSRIVIPRRAKDAWDPLRAVRVEVVASPGQNGGTLIDAAPAFQLRFEGHRKIAIEIVGRRFDIEVGNFPLGAWLSLTFAHNGINEFWYTYDWHVAVGPGEESGFGTTSPRPAPGAVPPIGPEGIWIGRKSSGPAGRFEGSIASVKMWRADPQAVIKTLVSRPMPPAVVDCWVDYRRRIDEVLEAYPECAAWMRDVLGIIERDINLKLSGLSPETLAEFRAICESYRTLWSAGKVGTPEMAAVGRRMRDWLKAEGIFSADDPGFLETLQHPCLIKLTEAIGGLECDPEAGALLAAILGTDPNQPPTA